MSALELPTISLSRVYHIGAFQGLPAGERDSHEGNTLSVSHAPEAWRQIARRGGLPLWELHRPGGSFLDVFELHDKHDQILEESASQGYLRHVALFRAYSGDEDGEEIYSSYLTEAAAMEEEPERIERVAGFMMTSRLADMFAVGVDRIAMAEDFAIMAYAQRLGMDGVWWRETYAPAAYSAPRGCIFQDRVRGWNAREIDFSAVDDEALLERFPRAQLRRFELDSGAGLRL